MIEGPSNNSTIVVHVGASNTYDVITLKGKNTSIVNEFETNLCNISSFNIATNLISPYLRPITLNLFSECLSTDKYYGYLYPPASSVYNYISI